MELYKILNGLESCQGELKPRENGIHLCRGKDLVGWLHKDIYHAEHRGEIVECDDKVVVREARIVSHIDNWNDRTARLFAVWCARQVQHLMTDKRSLDALDIAEKYAKGMASKTELNAARVAARAAASDAAWAAAWDAARVAARVAARDAARAAARVAARVAAWAAARAAASDAAWAAASDAAWAAQTKKLLDIFEKGI